MGAAPIIIEALLRSVSCIQRLWELPKRRYSSLATYAIKNLLNMEIFNQWFEPYGRSINALTLFQYSSDCPHLNMTKMEKDIVILTDIINVENKITSIIPKISLGQEDGPL